MRMAHHLNSNSWVSLRLRVHMEGEGNMKKIERKDVHAGSNRYPPGGAPPPQQGGYAPYAGG